MATGVRELLASSFFFYPQLCCLVCLSSAAGRFASELPSLHCRLWSGGGGTLGEGEAARGVWEYSG
jgi:hypothetical protein